MPHLPSLIRRPAPEAALTGPISAFESETQSVMQKVMPRRLYAVSHVIVAMLTLAVILMSFAKLDRVVASNGRIITKEGSLFVQPLDRANSRRRWRASRRWSIGLPPNAKESRISQPAQTAP